MATGVPKSRWKGTYESRADVDNGLDVSLSYEGKEASDAILATKPAELIKVWPEHIYSLQESTNRLYAGDNLPILASLLKDPKVNGKVRLVYIDPPFATSSIFQTREQSDAYSDLLAGAHFIEFLRKRLIILRELLADDGSIYVHLDENMAFHIKIIMDEVFGRRNFRNWITRKKCNPKNYTRKTYGNVSDFILFYTKSDNYVWHRPVEGWTHERAMKEYQCVEEKTGRRYKKVPIHAPGVRNGETGKPWRGMESPPGKHWQYTPDKLEAMEARGEIYWSPTGNPRRKIYLDESEGIPVQDIWLEFRDAHNQNIKITGYPTEKNRDMLARIIEASSNPGDLVLDCFCGSGTIMSVASELGRNWIGVDNSAEAISTVLNRFAFGTQPMGDFVNGKKKEAEQILSLFESLEDLTEEKNISSKPLITNFDLHAEKYIAPLLANVIAEWNKNIGYEKRHLTVNETQPHYLSSALIPKAVKHIADADPIIAELITKIGTCKLARKTEGFEALAEAIIKQQLSRKAAHSIFLKILETGQSKHLTNDLLHGLSDEKLRRCGLSARKTSYLRSLQQNVLDGSLDFARLNGENDEQVIEELTHVKGVGRWTAEMYLIFVLLRPDIFPLDDAAIRSSLCKLYGIEDSRFLEYGVQISDKWRPYRSIGCWYLWAYLNDIQK